VYIIETVDRDFTGGMADSLIEEVASGENAQIVSAQELLLKIQRAEL